MVHNAIYVAHYGVDPVSGWLGDLVDEHTSDRYHAYWSLEPYNAMAATTQILLIAFELPSQSPGPIAPGVARSRPGYTTSAPPTFAAVPAIPALPALPSVPASASDAAAIDRVIGSALTLQQTADVPALPVRGTPLTGRVAQAMKAEVRSRTAGLFTGTEQTNRERLLRQAIDHATSGNVRPIGGGATNVRFGSLAISASGATASVDVTADMWREVAQDQGNGRLVVAKPHNIVLFHFDMAQSSGQWKITREDWKFAPGSEP